MMFFDDLSIRADHDPQTVTMKEFLTAPEKILDPADHRIWVGSEETLQQVPDTNDSQVSETAIVQFHSDPIMQELLEVASPSVNAGLGISSLTSVPKSIVEASLSSRKYDVARKEPALNVEFFLSIADRCESWNLLSRPATSFRYFSPLPAFQPASDQKLLDTIRSLSDDQLTDGNPVGTAAIEIRAGLLLIHDYLEPSHQYSQSIEGEGSDVNGDYWHGIMHRREPDFGNSKYWFRRVGDHPCFVRLAAAARQLMEQFYDSQADEWIEKLTRSGWDSMAAVDFFQEAHAPHYKGTAFQQFAGCLQMQEMLILLTHCCRQCQRS
jgi:hypothetical protein